MPSVLGLFGAGFIGSVVIVGIAILFVFGASALLAYRKVDQGQALIINSPFQQDPKVTFTGAFVIPLVHRVEVMDISVKTVEIDRRGQEGLICKDNIRADITVTFFVKVNRMKEDVRRVASNVGCDRASDQDKIEELFAAKFSEALKTVGKTFEFEELYGERVDFRQRIIEVIGEDLNGYVLEDAAIDYLEQTPLQDLDDENVLDSHGIRKITEITSNQRVKTNELSNEAEKDIGKDNLEAKKALLEYEKQEADAEAQQQKEIEAVQSRQQAQAEEIQAKQRAKAEQARIEADEEIEKRKIESQQEQEVADKNRERVVAIEDENVEKERQLQVISRERETELKRIEKDKEVEQEKKEIAEIERDRISVEKTKAEEEENIKDLREIKEAERQKEASVIEAESEAEQQLIADKKQAEAKEKVAKHESREKVTRADAEVESAERIAKAKKKRAEGIQAEEAAPGLAEVQVKEADAQAKEKEGMVDAKIQKEQMKAKAEGEEEQGMVDVRLQRERAEAKEKEGMAEAKVEREKMKAKAEGEEEQGMAEVRVQQEQAEALKKEGMAEAEIEREKMKAKAEGEEEQGMVDVRLTEAQAEAQKKEGAAEAEVTVEKGQAEAKALKERKQAEADGIREELAAEASGISEKAKAMKEFDEDGREHEEFRLQLEHNRELDLERIGQSVDLVEAQAEVMGEAFKAADIDIVGGDDAFFENFIRSVSAGKTVEGFMDRSPTAQNLLQNLTGGTSGNNGVPSAGGGDSTIELAGDGIQADGGTSKLSDILDALKDETDEEQANRIQALIEMVEDSELDELQPGDDEPQA